MRSTSTRSSKTASSQTSEYPEHSDNSVGLGLRSRGLKGRALWHAGSGRTKKRSSSSMPSFTWLA